MLVHKKLMLLISAATLTGVMAMTGCGDDDSNNNPGTDAGGDVVNPDHNVPGSEGGETDGGDGGCRFNDFVLGLINSSTNATALPSTDLGDKCVDDHTPFPASTF